MDIKDYISNFHKRQKNYYGYLKYKVRTEKEKLSDKIVFWHFVDAYMQNGLLIKTCKTNLNEFYLIEFVNKIKGEMQND